MCWKIYEMAEIVELVRGGREFRAKYPYRGAVAFRFRAHSFTKENISATHKSESENNSSRTRYGGRGEDNIFPNVRDARYNVHIYFTPAPGRNQHARVRRIDA